MFCTRNYCYNIFVIKLNLFTPELIITKILNISWKNNLYANIQVSKLQRNAMVSKRHIKTDLCCCIQLLFSPHTNNIKYVSDGSTLNNSAANMVTSAQCRNDFHTFVLNAPLTDGDFTTFAYEHVSLKKKKINSN